jgi:hypothetical protein
VLGDYSKIPLPRKRKQTAVDSEDDHQSGSGKDDFSVDGEKYDCKQMVNKRRGKAQIGENESLVVHIGDNNAEGKEVPFRLSQSQTPKDDDGLRQSGRIGNNARRFSARLLKKQRLS